MNGHINSIFWCVYTYKRIEGTLLFVFFLLLVFTNAEGIKKKTLVTHSYKYAWQNIYNTHWGWRVQASWMMTWDAFKQRGRNSDEEKVFSWVSVCWLYVDSKWDCYVIQSFSIIFKGFRAFCVLGEKIFVIAYIFAL